MKKISIKQNIVNISKKKLGIFKNVFLEQFVTKFMMNGKKSKSEFFFYKTVFLLQFFLKVKFKFLLYNLIINNLSPNKLVSKRVRKERNFIPLIVSLNSSLKNVIKLCILNLKNYSGSFFNSIFKFLLEIFNSVN
jgi:hypothetical protein